MKLKNLKVKVSILFLCFITSVAQPDVPLFECQTDITHASHAEGSEALTDELWRQVLLYLRGFRAALVQPAGCMDSARAVIQTRTDDDSGAEIECVSRYRDVELALKHIDLILEYPMEARSCFDPQKTYDKLQLYTPSREMQQLSEIVAWLNRPTLEEYYTSVDDEIIANAGKELSKSFIQLLEATSSPAGSPVDVTFNGLPDLWSAAGWIPFYAENERVLNPRFRGGYGYAEVMGPWGMLRIESINEESVGLELGMTVQLGNTFYPYHFHHPQEIYITLSEPACAESNEFFALHWDHPLLNHKAVDNGWLVSVGPAATGKFLGTTTESGRNITYFERNTIHAFSVNRNCNVDETTGLVSIWARTTSRDNEQSTRICSLVSETRDALRPATRDGIYQCEVRNWLP